jgi:hypothetical protein
VLNRGLADKKRSGTLREILFSPVWDSVDFQELAQWVLEDHLPVRYQIQLHKVIWGANVPGVYQRQGRGQSSRSVFNVKAKARDGSGQVHVLSLVLALCVDY